MWCKARPSVVSRRLRVIRAVYTFAARSRRSLFFLSLAVVVSHAGQAAAAAAVVPFAMIDESTSIMVVFGDEQRRGDASLLVRSPLHYSKSVVTNVLYFLLSIYFYLDLQGGMFFSWNGREGVLFSSCQSDNTMGVYYGGMDSN